MELLYIFPVTSGKYWYFSAYFCLYFFIPFLNYLIDNLPEYQFKRLLLIGFILLSCSLIIRTDLDCFMQVGGYNAWWLSYLYLLGASIKKYTYFTQLASRKAFILYVISVLLTFLFKLFVEWLQKINVSLISKLATFYSPNRFISYISPTILCASIFLFVACINLKIPNWIAVKLGKISPLVFQVYIIHEYPLIRDNLLLNHFTGYSQYSSLTMISAVLLTAMLIFSICILIDYVRTCLFRTSKITILADKIIEKSTNLMLSFFNIYHINISK